MRALWLMSMAVGGLLCSSAFADVARAQTTSSDEIKRQIAELQKQLEFLEKNREADAKVTQLGGVRRDSEGAITSVRVYDVGDLFAVAPPYPAAYDSDLTREGGLIFPSSEGETGGFQGLGGFGGGMNGGGAGFNVQEGTAASDMRTSIEELIEAIETSISPASWSAVGGANTIAQLGTSLIVSADSVTHEQIEGLIGMLRQKWGAMRTVSVRSYWLWLTEAELAGLVADDAAANGRIRQADKSYGIVDPKAFERHLASLREGDDKPAGYRSTITCFSGQTVHTTSGRQSAVTTGYIPVIDGETGVAFRVVRALVQEGAVMQVMPRIAASSDEVVLNIQSRVCVREPVADDGDDKKIDQESPTVGARRMATMIEGRSLQVHRLSTTLRVPLDKPILVGGMTNGEESHASEPNLYLFVNVAVQERRDDKQAAEKQKVDAPPAADSAK